MEVSRAQPSHAGVVADLLHAFNTEYDAPVPSRDDLTRRFTDLLRRDDVIVLLAGDPEHPSGFALLTLRPTPYFDGPLAQLEELYVAPDRRAGGIGTALMTSALETLRSRGCGELHINVDEVDVDARRFYERLGFVNVEPGTDWRMLCYLREL